MPLFKIVILAVVQGLAELLPVSSSAHVVVAEKLLHLDPASPPMTLLLVMLHTGTMFAVIVYYWRSWAETYFKSKRDFQRFGMQLILATALTGLVGLSIITVIEKVALRPQAQVEEIFGHLELIAPALGAVGVLILAAGITARRRATRTADSPAGNAPLSISHAALIGLVQGLCLPFRGFSRSGATISTGMLLGDSRRRVEAFSFALAVVLTPAVIVREVWRLLNAPSFSALGAEAASTLASTLSDALLGALVAFLAGLAALKWLSRWLETDRWYLFGIYCLVAACGVGYLHSLGY